MASKGKRAGSRRARRRPPTTAPILVGLAAGVTLLVVAWGYLVYAAVDFGSSARGGDSRSWWFLALASAGAVACLFAGLMLIARLLRALGVTSTPEPAPATAPTDEPPTVTIPRPPGGRRAAR
ncbi:hypothetical protein [Nocardioides pantholopis]|uniref:hypothetical protein n=1 Tax=Nocardioides pantholopis TaxID=2483798 RepID=UPI000FD96811|nr:hypothetical protein [Nocardioides pantholopis]